MVADALPGRELGVGGMPGVGVMVGVRVGRGMISVCPTWIRLAFSMPLASIIRTFAGLFVRSLTELNPISRRIIAPILNNFSRIVLICARASSVPLRPRRRRLSINT